MTRTDGQACIFGSAGDAWEALTSFTKILQALATALEVLSERTNDSVVCCLRRLADEYREKMDNFNGPKRERHMRVRLPRLAGC